MNKKEAIDRIKQTPLYRYESSGKYVDGKECSDLFNALDCGIKALEELNLYEENGLCLIPTDVYKKQCEELDRLKEKERLESSDYVSDSLLIGVDFSSNDEDVVVVMRFKDNNKMHVINIIRNEEAREVYNKLIGKPYSICDKCKYYECAWKGDNVKSCKYFKKGK